jgi:murein DD-endopeptidase MepM/ murein hydrolase activator NlpD
VDAEVLSETVLKEAESQIVARGTVPVPAREGTGTFIWPTAGYISSPFGWRWGRMHYGVDIARWTGTPIYASDGGTVIASSWNDSYGYYILIDHGNGISTRYAHCSKLLVNYGEKVYQGQKIALMGSTGHSTGPHCHFEVRINETPKDPLNYLP